MITLKKFLNDKAKYDKTAWRTGGETRKILEKMENAKDDRERTQIYLETVKTLSPTDKLFPIISKTVAAAGEQVMENSIPTDAEIRRMEQANAAKKQALDLRKEEAKLIKEERADELEYLHQKNQELREYSRNVRTIKTLEASTSSQATKKEQKTKGELNLPASFGRLAITHTSSQVASPVSMPSLSSYSPSFHNPNNELTLSTGGSQSQLLKKID